MEFKEKPKETFNKVRFLDYYMEGHAGFIAGGCFKNIFKNLNYYTAVELYKQLEVEEKLIKEKKDRISYVYNITIENENNM